MPTLQYRVVERQNALTKQLMYYAQKVGHGIDRIKTDDLIDSIAENSQVPRAVVPAALAAIQKSIVNFVLNGHSVTIPRLGTFNSTLSSRAALSADAFSAANIKGLRVRFRPDPKLRERCIYDVNFQLTTVFDPDSGEDEGGL